MEYISKKVTICTSLTVCPCFLLIQQAAIGIFWIAIHGFPSLNPCRVIPPGLPGSSFKFGKGRSTSAARH